MKSAKFKPWKTVRSNKNFKKKSRKMKKEKDKERNCRLKKT